MAWFKVSDALWAHPKWISLTPNAKALWITAASWSVSYETFGQIPAKILSKIGQKSNIKRYANELVLAGLWDEVDGGYTFHDWSDYNITKTAWESQKATTRERVKRHRNGKKNTKSNDATQTTSNATCNAVTSEHEQDIDTPNGVSHPLTPSQGAPSVQPLAPLAETEPEPDQKPAPEPAPATSSTPDCRSGFEAFWDAYRRHGNKTQARKAYKTARKAGYSAQWLTQQAASYHQRADAAHTPPQYRKHAATWLNNAGWDDQFTPQHSQQPASLLTRSQQAAAVSLQAALAEQHAAPTSPSPRALTTGCEVPF